MRRAAPLGSGGRSAPAAARGRRFPRGRCGRRAAADAARSPPRAGPARWRSESARRERRLRRTVTRLRACLDGLPTLERRVLVLRAGLGPRRPRPRARVARVLDLSTARVRASSGADSGDCAGSPVAGAAVRRTTDGAAAAPTTGEPPTTTVLAVAPLEDRVEVKGEQGLARRDAATGRAQARADPRVGPARSCRPLILGEQGRHRPDRSRCSPSRALLAIAFGARGAIRSHRS